MSLESKSAVPYSFVPRDISGTLFLLDVDETLVVTSFGSPDSYNDDLIHALLDCGCRQVFLATRMNLRSSQIEDRKKLLEYLGRKGIHVLGIAVPADFTWHLPRETLEAFDKKLGAALINPDTGRQQPLNERTMPLVRLGEEGCLLHPEEDALLIELIKKDYSGQLPPGSAYREASLARTADELLPHSTHDDLCSTADGVVRANWRTSKDLQKVPMFIQFKTFFPGVTQFVMVDDTEECLAGARHVFGGKVITVNPWHRDPATGRRSTRKKDRVELLAELRREPVAPSAFFHSPTGAAKGRTDKTPLLADSQSFDVSQATKPKKGWCC